MNRLTRREEFPHELRTAEGYAATFLAFHETLGLDRLQVFHFNDCKRALGSRVDRHEHIGRGELGLEPFRRLLTVVTDPFTERPGLERYTEPAPESFGPYQTFCGT